MQELRVRSLGWEDSLGKEMATHSSILNTHISILAGEFDGQRSLTGYSPWCGKTVGHDSETKQQQYMAQCS